MSETIERVLINKNTGVMTLGIRVRFHDKYHAEQFDMGAMNGYSLRLEPQEFDCWALFNGSDSEARGPWLLVPGADFTNIEDLGPL